MNNMQMGQMPMVQMPMGQIPMGQIPMGQMPMGQIPMAQMNMQMGQMPMVQMNMQMGQMPMTQMNMGVGQMNMNNMFMMYMNNQNCFNNQNFNMYNSMNNLNSQIASANLNNVNNPMSYSTGNIIPNNNNDEDKDKGVLPRKGNTEDDIALPITGDTINVKFDTSTGVKKIVRADSKKTTLKQLLKMYMNKIGLPESLIGEQVVFLFCGERVDVNSDKPLCEHNIRNMSAITVFDQGNVIGAYNI